ncbi:MAG: hypothetical protein JXR86_18930 [Spirochaetales bacterium]|nr:hypothetical protein [Spirochaetales bacterium]
MEKILLCLFALPFLWGCQQPAGEVPASEKGEVLVSLAVPPEKSLSGSDSSTASLYSDKYEVLIYNDSEAVSALLAQGETGTSLSVPAGTYTVLVLAGSSRSSEGVLLGSGFSAGVSVLADSITEVAITLLSVSHSLSVPDEIICSETFDLTIEGNTNNELLQISANGTVMENRPYVEESGDATNLYLDCTVSGALWTGTIELTANLSPAASGFSLFGSNVKLVDPVWGIDVDLKEIGSVNWKWMNDSLVPAELEVETFRNVEYVEASTGLAVTIGWG